MSISVKVNGIDTAKAGIKDLPANTQRETIRAMSVIAERSVESGAARHNGDGSLFQSVFNRAISGGREVGHDPQRAPHAAFVIFGTRPHKIYPNKKKILRWAGPGGFIFARVVNHPGYIGDNYMARAADEALRQFDAIVTNALKDS